MTLIQYENIQKALGVDIAISKRMAAKILLWSRLYLDEAPWLKDDIKSLSLPAAISTEMTRLVTMELKYNMTGGSLASFLSGQFQKVYANLPRYVEYGCSTGGLVFKPYLEGDKIAVDYVQAGNFFPTAFNSSGQITACVFPEFKQTGRKLYTRLEYHKYQDNVYSIVNKAFVSNSAAITMDNIYSLGSEIPLSEVDGWADLEPYVEFYHATGSLFSYFKVPIANNIDTNSPLGVSCYARAVNQIRDADQQYGATLWEYRSKETAIQAGDEFFQKNRNGEIVLPKGKERIYHALGDVTGKDGAPFFNAYSPDIRDQSFFNGYNRIIQKVEFNCGLAYGTLSDPQTVDKTAEEIKASKQRSYATVKSIQNSLEAALKTLLDAMAAWVEIGGLPCKGGYDVAFDWDDSIVVDKDKEREQDRKDVSMMIMRPEEYRAKYYGETLEQAAKNLPEPAAVEE